MNEGRIEGLHFHHIELENDKPKKAIEEMVDFKEYKESYTLANNLTSAASVRTMTTIENNMRKSLPLFIESGNNHKCLGVQVAKKLGHLFLTVADGNKLQMPSSVKNCKLNLNYTTFRSDIMVMVLGCWTHN
ncbi:hypothetical protein TanjilG_18060 [Lupinus angustifolius]|uniref:Uncharacterized protein n=1 Tax=Lupinus angustifolius TaxID=3871 RepID=A0A1J7GVJ4_LUPAN|nr:hypothetical protein TanjilG_18060 [Lupinus angustifolius]